MKLVFAFCIALIGTFVISCSNTGTPKPEQNTDKRKLFTDVVDYNDYLVDQIDAIQLAHDRALDPDKTLEEALKECDSLIVVCKKSAKNIKGIQPFEGDSSLAMQMLEYIRFMNLSGEKHLRAFLQMQEKYLNMTDQETPEGEKLSKSLDEKVAKLNAAKDSELDRVNKVQKKFAERHQMMIMRKE